MGDARAGFTRPTVRAGGTLRVGCAPRTACTEALRGRVREHGSLLQVMRCGCVGWMAEAIHADAARDLAHEAYPGTAW